MTSAAVAVTDTDSRDFYVRSMALLNEAGVPFLVGGSYAFARYTGIDRHSKDFDIFIARCDYERAAEAFERAGFRTDLTFSHWIGKVYQDDDFVDLIFSSGNGIAQVDDLWFKYAVPDRVLGMDVMLIPAEEMIWSKGLIMERERFDGADIAHLFRSLGPELDWYRLLYRFGEYWRALYAHLILFGFIYPSRRSNIPQWVMEDLGARLAREIPHTDTEDKVCYGTILSRQQYLVDVNHWGCRDARLKPLGTMSAEEIARWTMGIEIDGTK